MFADIGSHYCLSRGETRYPALLDCLGKFLQFYLRQSRQTIPVGLLFAIIGSQRTNHCDIGRNQIARAVVRFEIGHLSGDNESALSRLGIESPCEELLQSAFHCIGVRDDAARVINAPKVHSA